jgi:hypothetical protein
MERPNYDPMDGSFKTTKKLNYVYPPRFHRALEILQRYRHDPFPHQTPTDDKAFWKDPLKYIRREATQIKCLKDFDANQTYRVIKGELEPNSFTDKRRYLPVVAFSFESTMREFGLFLSTHGFAYVLLMGNDPPRMQSRAKKSYPLGKGPICILLHPSIVEGLSLTYSPAMICMEVIQGYGVQEQVYARILRSLSYTCPITNQKERPMKTIYQMYGIQDVYSARSYAAIKDEHRDRRYRKLATNYLKYTGVSVPFAFGAKFINQTFESTKWHSGLSSMPEYGVLNQNNQQKKILDSLAKVFSETSSDCETVSCTKQQCTFKKVVDDENKIFRRCKNLTANQTGRCYRHQWTY